MPNTPDYLLIGHVCRDVVAGGYRPGGTAAYAANTAHQLGCATAVLTSASTSYDLTAIFPPAIAVERVPASHDTVFENQERDGRRWQKIHSVANRLAATHLPPAWHKAPIIHLAPIANEVDPHLIDLFRNHLIGLTPQGWMRQWDEAGQVTAKRLAGGEALCRKATAVILSEEDLPEPGALEPFIYWANLLVLTRGAAGCTVYHHGRLHDIPAPAIDHVADTTGAGDIFAAAFLIRLWRNGGDPFEAARFATQCATRSVAHLGLAEKMGALRE